MRPKDWQAHISTPDAFDEAPDTARMPSVTTPEESRKDTVDADDGRTTRRNPAPHYEDARTHDDSRAPRARHLQHAHARVGPTSSTGPGERAPRGRARALEGDRVETPFEGFADHSDDERSLTCGDDLASDRCAASCQSCLDTCEGEP
jgi:hypothetical protein